MMLCHYIMLAVRLACCLFAAGTFPSILNLKAVLQACRLPAWY